MTRAFAILFAAGVLGAGAPALAQMGPILDLSWRTIDGGGGTSTGSGFTLSGTIGQHDAGVLSGTVYTVTGGFWPGITKTCYPDCNDDRALNLADFGCFQNRFALQDLYADCNGDGQLNLADFGCFQTRLVLGCP